MGLIVVAFFGGLVLGIQPGEVQKGPREYLVELYQKPIVDEVNLEYINIFSDSCVIGVFSISGVFTEVLVCSKSVTREELIEAGGGDGAHPPFIGRLFDYQARKLGFTNEDTDESRNFAALQVSKVVRYVES